MSPTAEDTARHDDGSTPRKKKFNGQITFPIEEKYKTVLRRYAERHGSFLAQIARQAAIEFMINHKLLSEADINALTEEPDDLDNTSE